MNDRDEFSKPRNIEEMVAGLQPEHQKRIREQIQLSVGRLRRKSLQSRKTLEQRLAREALLRPKKP